MWDTILPVLLQILGVIVSTAATAALVAVNSFVRQKAGDAAAKAAMDMLHKALETGVNAAVVAKPNADTTTIVNDAIAHAKQSIPDTLSQLMPSGQVLVNIALSKLFKAK